MKNSDTLSANKTNECGYSEENIKVIDNDIYFYSPVSPKSAMLLNGIILSLSNQIKINAVSQKDKTYTETITLHIYSYGGYLAAGFSILDCVQNNDIPVETIVEGQAASAATLISIAGKKRYAKKHSTFLIHQLSTSFWGSYQDLKDEKTNCDMQMKMLTEFYLNNTKIPKKLLEESFFKRDILLNANQALKYKIIDKII